MASNRERFRRIVTVGKHRSLTGYQNKSPACLNDRRCWRLASSELSENTQSPSLVNTQTMRTDPYPQSVTLRSAKAHREENTHTPKVLLYLLSAVLGPVLFIYSKKTQQSSEEGQSKTGPRNDWRLLPFKCGNMFFQLGKEAPRVSNQLLDKQLRRCICCGVCLLFLGCVRRY